VTNRTARLLLLVIVLAYAGLGALYALRTPAWQAPDEPAHYNYVRYVAEEGRLPVLAPGDYPAAYLEEIKARRFPADMSIAPLRYEAHQPPLYYLLAAGVYRLAAWAGAPTLLALRLFSVLLGALGLLAGYRALRLLFPADPLIPLGALALAGALPQHVAMTAAVNNDVLAEALVALCVWRALAIAPRGGVARDGWAPRRAVGLGLLLGLAFLTKMQSYVGWAVAGWVMAQDAAQDALRDGATRATWRARAGRLLRYGGIAVGTALVVALPWLARNAAIYGLGDPLAMARHDLVVRGQPTTAALVAAEGYGGLAVSFLRTTFRSFWGQFGWMGVPLDGRLYQALGMLTGLAGLGLLLGIVRARRGEGTAPWPRGAAAVLAVWIGVTTLGYLWWNLRYVQHQGRYLFPAILALGAVGTLGLREALAAPLRRTLPVLGALLLALMGLGLWRGSLPRYPLALVAAAGLGLAGLHLAERVSGRRLTAAAVLGVYAGVWALALWALGNVVVPALAPL
jgi:hypothetical protein